MNMLREILLAVLLPPLLLLGWLAVQGAWRNTFLADGDGDDDVLAARGGCGQCSCTGTCQREAIENDNRRFHQ